MSRRGQQQTINEMTAWMGIIVIGGAMGVVIAILAWEREYMFAFVFFMITVAVLFFLILYLLEHIEQ
jgi:hypothetical protein